MQKKCKRRTNPKRQAATVRDEHGTYEMKTELFHDVKKIVNDECEEFSEKSLNLLLDTISIVEKKPKYKNIKVEKRMNLHYFHTI